MDFCGVQSFHYLRKRWTYACHDVQMNFASFFGLALSLYNIDGRLSERNNLPDNLLQMPSDKLYEITASLATLDYNPIWTTGKANVTKTIADELLSTVIPQIEAFASSCKFLKIAIIRDRIELTKNSGMIALVMSTSKNTGKTLKCLNEDAILLKGKIETYLTRLDEACGNRFQWKDKRSRLSKVPMGKAILEDFWAEHKSPKLLLSAKS